MKKFTFRKIFALTLILSFMLQTLWTSPAIAKSNSQIDVIQNGEITVEQKVLEKLNDYNYLIKFKDDNGKTKVKKDIEEKGGKIDKEFKNIKAIRANISADLLTQLKNDPNVETIEQDFAVKSLGDVAEETIPWGVNEVSSTIAHQEGITGKGVKVAVFDTGINEHSDLSISGGKSFVTGTDSFRDDNGHGTHIAGIMASLINNKGIIGVSPSVELYSVKVLDSSGNGRYSSIIEAVEWAIDNKINLINMSFGGSEKSKILEDALQMAYDNNILIFAAAGNGGKGSNDTILYPAKYKQVVAVGAIDKNEQRAEFSSVGAEMELVAPGVDIESTLSDGVYGNKSGTSMAAPHATGVAALLWSKDTSLKNQNIRDLLNQSAIGLGDNDLYGNGLVNARYALELYNDYDDVKTGKKEKVTKVKKQKFPASNEHKSTDPSVTTAGIVESYTLDSPHPYSNNYDSGWTVIKPGASNIRVHFSYIDVESGYDTVTTTANDYWSGHYTDVWSSWSGSSNIVVWLASDGSVTYNGFHIDMIEYVAPSSDDHGNNFSSATYIQVGSTYSGNINYVGDVDYFRFTPTVSGNHIIETSGSTDTFGYLYNGSQTQLDFDDDDGDASNFMISWNLTANQTYYIQVRHYGGNNYGTGAYGLRVTAPVANDDHANDQYNSTRIYYNSPASGNINYVGDVDFFKFIPTVSKSYGFKSTGSTDTLGYLYDSSGSPINNNDDYDTLNFNMTEYLTAGNTYYLKVQHWNNTSTGAYSVIVTDAILGDASYVSSFTNPQNPNVAFNQIISDVDNYGSQLNDFGSDNVANFNYLVSSTVKLVGGVVDRVMHFARNKINRAPSSLQGMVDYINEYPSKKWRMLPATESLFHMNDGEVYNIKFVSPDEHFEAVYNAQTMLLVDSPSNMGTYNFVGPSDKTNHETYDVNPFFQYGNTEDQNLNRTLEDGRLYEGGKAAANLALFYANYWATSLFDTYYNLYK